MLLRTRLKAQGAKLGQGLQTTGFVLSSLGPFALSLVPVLFPFILLLVLVSGLVDVGNNLVAGQTLS